MRPFKPCRAALRVLLEVHLGEADFLEALGDDSVALADGSKGRLESIAHGGEH